MARTTTRAVGALITALSATAALSGCGLLGGGVPTAEVGECVVSAELGTAEIDAIPTVECTEPHDLEVYHKEDLTLADYDYTAVGNAGFEICTGDAFADYVGVDYMSSEIYATFISPSSESWASGDREILCLLESDELITTSLEGANR